MTLDEKRRQVAAQCEAVMVLAQAVANMARASAALCNTGPGPWDDVLDAMGRRTAREMEALGDMLNGMDAVGPDSERLAPVFEAAQRLWPVEG